MGDSAYDADLELALALADEADALSMRGFGSHDLDVRTKSDGTPVSAFDVAVEELLRQRLAVARPQDSVLGEEDGEAARRPRRWIIDPIDGTKNYVRGVPVWATLIAMQEGDDIVCGVVSAPALQRRWWAASGGGAFAGGRPITVSETADVGAAYLSITDLADFQRRGMGEALAGLAGDCRATRGFGDFWSHMLVAEGVIDISAELPVALWDVAALTVIVAEAGGVVTDFAGEAVLAGSSIVSSNGRLHAAVLERLAPGRGR